MNQNREQRRNINRQGYSGMMNGTTRYFKPLNPFEKKEDKKEVKPKKKKNKVRPVSYNQIAEANDNWYRKQFIKYQRRISNFQRYNAIMNQELRNNNPFQEIPLPSQNEPFDKKQNTDLEKKIVVKSLNNGYAFDFPIKDENTSWRTTASCYIDNNPFGNCQVFCVAHFDKIAIYKGNPIEVIEKIRSRVYKKQMIFDFRTDQKENIKLFDKMVKKYNLLWQNDYTNGTGAPMRTAMIKLVLSEEKSTLQKLKNIF